MNRPVEIGRTITIRDIPAWAMANRKSVREATSDVIKLTQGFFIHHAFWMADQIEEGVRTIVAWDDTYAVEFKMDKETK